MLFIIIGLLFSILGMFLFIRKENANLQLLSSMLGVLNIMYGLVRITKANKVNGKNL